MPVLEALVEMLPRIQAEEAMSLAQATALGTGSMAKHDARRVSRDLDRQARGRQSGRVATEHELSAMGMGVRKVKRKG